MKNIVVFADTVAVCTCDSVAETLYIVLSLYFIQNIEYCIAVNSSLQFLQLKCLNIECKPRLGVSAFMQMLGQ